MSKQANYFAIGVFVIIASVLGALTLIFLGSGRLTKQTAELLVTFRGSANGLLVGAKVKTYGVEIGSVRKVMLHKEERTGEIVIPVLIEIDLTNLGGLLGHRDAMELTGEAFESIIRGGACAKLQVENLLTGLLYVELELGSRQQGFVLLSDRFAGYLSLPTVPTDMERMLDTLQKIVENLGTTDFHGLIDETKGIMVDLRTELRAVDFQAMAENLDGLLTDSRRMVNDPGLARAVDDLGAAMQALRRVSETLDAGTGDTLVRFNASLDQMQGTLRELEAASASARSWLDPSSAVYQEVITVLDQISDASRSLRILADYLERNPNALITGRTREENNP